ncbi:MAG: formyltransferase [Rhodocyclaceae bacterium]|nr:formyltransferase [Rhodocyclaceae bacterium]MBX3668610.1 formyltransferase [Rhodocyclaceae bacterium]
MTRAVVFAYHNVGVRCLKVLLAHGVDVALVVTHRDAAGENIWFDSVAACAADYGLAVAYPDEPNAPDFVARVAVLKPDFLFSFYYRHMLCDALLAAAPRGAYNMHGSLLPKYRGRVPVNWAVLHGERETGATLHAMLTKPDAGAIAGQVAVPILPDDTARAVFDKVTLAAEMVLDRALPGLMNGTLVLQPQNLAQGSYFGGRKPADGQIDWRQTAAQIHNLVRAVAPPYPGAFCAFAGGRLQIDATRVAGTATQRDATAGLYVQDGQLCADCGGGGVLHILSASLDGAVLDAAGYAARFGQGKLNFGETT